jgi:hypothetical protein
MMILLYSISLKRASGKRFSLKDSNVSASPINPYDSSRVKQPRLQYSCWLIPVTKSTLVISIVCIACSYLIGIARLPAPFWDRVSPRIHHMVIIVNVAIFVVGFLACCLTVILGTPNHRFAGILVALAYLPFLGGVIDWLLNRRWSLPVPPEKRFVCSPIDRLECRQNRSIKIEDKSFSA